MYSLPCTALLDFTALINEVLVFPACSDPGDSVCVDILINDDSEMETNEMFIVFITNTNVEITLSSAIVTIMDNDEGLKLKI